MNSSVPAHCDQAIATATDAKPTGASHPRLTLTATILASGLAFVDGSVVNVALPTIGQSFQSGAAELQWIVNAYLLPLSALLLLGGAAGDLYGRRRMLMLGLVLFLAASLLCAWAPSLAVLLTGRTLQGIGAAMLMPNSLAILGTAFTGEQRGRAIGTWAASGAVLGAVGPLVGGWLIDTVGWRSIFYLNIPIGLGALFLAARFVTESSNEQRPALDWGGGALATAGLAALTWGLTVQSAGSEGSGSNWSLAAIGAGAVLLLLFVFYEKQRGERAMMPVTLFGSKAFVGLTVLTFLLYGALGGLFVLLPYVLIVQAGYSALAAGAALLPLPIVIAGASRTMGRLAEKLGPRLPLTVGPLVVAGGFLLALRVAGGDGSYWTTVFPALVVISLGMAGAVAPLTTAVLGSVDARHTGTASGFNSAVARTGGMIATALLGWVLAARGDALVVAFQGAAVVGAVMALLSAMSAFALLKKSQS